MAHIGFKIITELSKSSTLARIKTCWIGLPLQTMYTSPYIVIILFFSPCVLEFLLVFILNVFYCSFVLDSTTVMGLKKRSIAPSHFISLI